jgi:hypothetical protein
MKTQHVSIASAAAVLVVSMAAFAQSPQPASPSSQGAQQSTTQASSQVTLVGCVMRESEYRQATDAGKGGPANTGIGRSDEFVLIHAKKGAGPAPATCSAAAGTGEAYELAGSREKDLEQYVNKAVEIRGTLKGADPFAAQQGAPGADPLKQGLKISQVDISSFRAAPAGQTAAAAAPAAQPPAPAAQPAPAPPPSEQSAAAPRQNLPRTASPLPLAGLLGLLSLAAGLALRRRA